MNLIKLPARRPLYTGCIENWALESSMVFCPWSLFVLIRTLIIKAAIITIINIQREDMNKMAISGSEYWHWEPNVIDESAPRQRHRAGTFSDWWRHRAEFEQKSFLSTDICFVRMVEGPNYSDSPNFWMHRNSRFGMVPSKIIMVYPFRFAWRYALRFEII